MAYTTMVMVNPHNGKRKPAPVGFSWTSLFFTMFVPLLRGHWVGAIVWGIAALCTFSLSGWVQAFFYNRMYINYLIGEGYQVHSSPMPVDLVSTKLNMSLPVLEQQPQ